MNPEPFSFRPLRASDKGAVLAISAKIWEGDDYLPHSFDEWVADMEGVFNGCFVGDRLVGFGRVGFVAPGHAWLEGLRKDPDAGVSGVGRALCLQGLRFLSGVGGLRSIRFSAYAHNPETIALNEAIGFRRSRTLSIKSKRLPGSPDGKEAFGLPAGSPCSPACRIESGTVDRVAVVARFRADGWFDGFRIESWKAWPLGAESPLRSDDILLAAPGPEDIPVGFLAGSFDPLKHQANIVAFSADTPGVAEALFAEFERLAVAAGYHYFEAVVPRRGELLAMISACGYVSWETEDDFLLYEWPSDRLGDLPVAQGVYREGVPSPEKKALSSEQTAG